MNKILYSTFVLLLTFVWIQVKSQNNTLTLNEKLYGLSRIWSEAKFNFPYFNHLTSLDIDSLYIAFIDKVISSENDFTYYQTLQAFTAHFKDNHTYVEFPQNIKMGQLSRNHFSGYKIGLSFIEDKVIISRVGSRNINELPIGTEVTHVDSIPVCLFLEERVYPFISSSSKQRKVHIGVENLLLGLVGTSTTISCKLPNGKTKNFTLTRAGNNDDWYPQVTESFYKIIEPGISYLRINDFSDMSIVDSLIFYIDSIRTSKALIIDIRENGGGSSIIAKDIAKYFLKDSLITGSLVKVRVNIGNQRERGLRLSKLDTLNNEVNKTNYLVANNLYLFPLGSPSFRNDLHESEKITDIPIVILTSAVNASASEEFLVYFNSQYNITMIGEPTGGGNGQPMLFPLPGGGQAAICVQNCSYPNGQEYYRIGIKPDILVEQTIYDLMQGKDTVLKASLDFLRNKIMNTTKN